MLRTIKLYLATSAMSTARLREGTDTRTPGRRHQKLLVLICTSRPGRFLLPLSAGFPAGKRTGQFCGRRPPSLRPPPAGGSHGQEARSSRLELSSPCSPSRYTIGIQLFSTVQIIGSLALGYCDSQHSLACV